MTVRQVLAALLLLACAGVRAEPVAGADPLTTAPCLAARSELAQAAAAVLMAPGARQQATRLAQARREAGRICLGQSAASASASRSIQPPVRVAPPLQGTPGVGMTQPSTKAPALQGPRPAVVTACDAGGCWDSEGRRLERAGPLLLGPQGACTLQGAQLNCP